MRLSDFSWEAFRQTGDIEAYLLIKNIENTANGQSEEQNHGEYQGKRPDFKAE